MKSRDFFDLKQEQTTPGGVIRAFRKNFKISQAELAEATGIGWTNLSAIENDRVEVGVKRAVLIAAAFGISPSSILFPNGFRSPYEKEISAVEKAMDRLHRKKNAKERGL